MRRGAGDAEIFNRHRIPSQPALQRLVSSMYRSSMYRVLFALLALFVVHPVAHATSHPAFAPPASQASVIGLPQWVELAAAVAPGWSAVGTSLDATVSALAFDDQDRLYAGGHFLTADGASVNYVAVWDGQAWTALGTGMNDWVFALAVDAEGHVYAGGRFTEAGGVAANRVARWDGTQWEAVGEGMNNPVAALAIGNDGTIYAGGGFRLTSGAGFHIAQWDGEAWSIVGGGMDNSVYSLAVDRTSGALYAGGAFQAAGGESASRVAVWNGEAWSPLGTGLNESVDALAVGDDGRVYAGGRFTASGDLTSTLDRIAVWTGAEWADVGSGVDERVSALAYRDGQLYVGGDFTVAGGLAVNRVARWTGTAWADLAGGVDDGGVDAFAFDAAGRLYAGGRFTSVGGGEGITWLARFEDTPTDAEPDGQPGAELSLTVAPNPGGTSTMVTLDLDAPRAVAVEVFDVLGRRLARLHGGPLGAGNHTFALGGLALRPGLYLVRATTSEGSATRRLTILH